MTGRDPRRHDIRLLDAARNDTLDELGRSRAGIVVAGDNERRRVERNLHDGVPQRVVAVSSNLGLGGELAPGHAAIHNTLEGSGESVDEAIDELREGSRAESGRRHGGFSGHAVSDRGIA